MPSQPLTKCCSPRHESQNLQPARPLKCASRHGPLEETFVAAPQTGNTRDLGPEASAEPISDETFRKFGHCAVCRRISNEVTRFCPAEAGTHPVAHRASVVTAVTITSSATTADHLRPLLGRERARSGDPVGSGADPNRNAATVAAATPVPLTIDTATIFEALGRPGTCARQRRPSGFHLGPGDGRNGRPHCDPASRTARPSTSR